MAHRFRCFTGCYIIAGDDPSDSFRCASVTANSGTPKVSNVTVVIGGRLISDARSVSDLVGTGKRVAIQFVTVSIGAATKFGAKFVNGMFDGIRTFFKNGPKTAFGAPRVRGFLRLGSCVCDATVIGEFAHGPSLLMSLIALKS